MKRLDPDIRKRMILKSAIKHILMTKNIITFSDHCAIASCEVKTSVSTLRRYFPRREDLIKAMCDESDEIKKLAIDMGVINDN